VREGSSSYWAVWIPLDTSVQQLLLNRIPPSVVDEPWLVVNEPTQAYSFEGEPLWVAEAGEWYRVVFADADWVAAVWENDPPENAVWFEHTDAIGLMVLQVPGPGAEG
jgi:hypothetical protein